MNSIVRTLVGAMIAGGLSVACSSSSTSGSTGGSGSNGATFACNIPRQDCETQSDISEDNITTDTQACASMGGTVVSDCSSEGPYSGCCASTSSTGGELNTCFYSQSGMTSAECTAGGGTWSTS